MIASDPPHPIFIRGLRDHRVAPLRDYSSLSFNNEKSQVAGCDSHAMAVERQVEGSPPSRGATRRRDDGATASAWRTGTPHAATAAADVRGEATVGRGRRERHQGQAGGVRRLPEGDS